MHQLANSLATGMSTLATSSHGASSHAIYIYAAIWVLSIARMHGKPSTEICIRLAWSLTGQGWVEARMCSHSACLVPDRPRMGGSVHVLAFGLPGP
eukprot:6435234-Alexandrium_andersonii.AAC.1